VATARGRWRVEQDYQQMKEELGRNMSTTMRHTA
jgi:hypothetical protein